VVHEVHRVHSHHLMRISELQEVHLLQLKIGSVIDCGYVAYIPPSNELSPIMVLECHPTVQDVHVEVVWEVDQAGQWVLMYRFRRSRNRVDWTIDSGCLCLDYFDLDFVAESHR